MADRENQDGILVGLKAIKRNIPSLTARDHQFSKIQFNWTTYQGMTLQYGDGLFNQFNCLRSRQRINLQQEICQVFKIDKRSFRVD